MEREFTLEMAYTGESEGDGVFFPTAVLQTTAVDDVAPYVHFLLKWYFSPPDFMDMPDLTKTYAAKLFEQAMRFAPLNEGEPQTYNELMEAISYDEMGRFLFQGSLFRVASLDYVVKGFKALLAFGGSNSFSVTLHVSDIE